MLVLYSNTEMARLEFSMNLPSHAEKLMNLAIDFESFPQYFPHLIKSVKILEKKEHETTTEEIFTPSTFLKHEIKQQSVHAKINTNELETRIILGPFKGTTIKTVYEKHDSGTKISVLADLKIALQYRILSTPIKKSYKQFLTGLLFKMNTRAIESS